MPFQTKAGSFERSKINVISAVEGVPSVRSRLERFTIAQTRVPVDEGAYDTIPTASLRRSVLPSMVFAVDGSDLEAEVVSSYPGAKVVYLTVATVLYRMDCHRGLVRKVGFPPHERDGLVMANCSPFALPLNNVIMDDCADPRESFRKAVYESLAETRPYENGAVRPESLLETYEHLLSLKVSEDGAAGKKSTRCAVTGCREAYVPHGGLRTCPCSRQETWYSTDRLGFWEDFGEELVSGSSYGEFRQVVELLHVVNLLRMLFDPACGAIPGASADNLLVMVDGPLAVFRHPSWLSRSIQKELGRLNAILTGQGSHPFAVIGIEKTGAFVDHFSWLDRHPSFPSAGDPVTRATRFPAGTLVTFDDVYIYSRITPRSDTGRERRPYGDETYFGKKVFYKNATGQRLVLTAWLPEGGSFPTFSRMGDITDILDEVGATRYENALVPLMEAHSEASLARNVGGRILTLHAISAMGINTGSGAGGS